MPQLQLPVFPSGTAVITSELAFERRDDQVVYFNGHLPVFTHTADLASFRFFTTQLIVNGTVRQSQIVKAFGVPLTTVKRSCRLHRRQLAVIDPHVAGHVERARTRGLGGHPFAGQRSALQSSPPTRTARHPGKLMRHVAFSLLALADNVAFAGSSPVLKLNSKP